MAPTTRTFYRPPEASVPVLIRTDRTGRLARFHWGARLGNVLSDAPLLTPEACNLDQAVGLVEVPGNVLPEGTRPEQCCRRCFRETAA